MSLPLFRALSLPRKRLQRAVSSATAVVLSPVYTAGLHVRVCMDHISSGPVAPQRTALLWDVMAH